jgi:hypothetical protein
VATVRPPEDVEFVSVDEKSAGVLNSGARKRFGGIAQLVCVSFAMSTGQTSFIVFALKLAVSDGLAAYKLAQPVRYCADVSSAESVVVSVRP